MIQQMILALITALLLGNGITITQPISHASGATTTTLTVTVVAPADADVKLEWEDGTEATSVVDVSDGGRKRVYTVTVPAKKLGALTTTVATADDDQSQVTIVSPC